MARGISLHIGVNIYERGVYEKLKISVPSLPNCDSDAVAKMAIATRFRFDTAILLNETATRREVLIGIEVAARDLDYGDMFFLSFSGHGSQVYDKDGDEDDHFDETWCLYDGMLVDDELFEKLKLFRPGVRVLVIADCCHSGTSIKNAERATGRRINNRFPVQKTDEIQAACLLMAACQDRQYTYAGQNLNNSLYTHCMLKVLAEYDFCSSYRELHERIVAMMPAKTKPNLFKFGPGADQFVKKRPFKI